MGEHVRACAQRELLEETGLALPLVPANALDEQVVLFVAEAPPDADVVLSAEHDA